MTTPFDKAKSAILGIPVDPNKQPSRTGLVQAFAEMQVQIEGAQAGAIIKATKSALDAMTSAPSVACMAWVTNDSTLANNGIYENTGTISAPVWTRRTDIPQFFISAVNVGAGTANAIQVTTDLPIPNADGRCLIAIPILADNTATPVTVSINGATAIPIKTNSGNNIAIGGLVANMIIIGFISGGNFRIVSDQTSSAIQAAAEAAQAAAEAAAASAQTIAPCSTRTVLKALDTSIKKVAYLHEGKRRGLFIWTLGNFASLVTADTTEAFYIKADAIATTTGAWVRNSDHISPQMCGATVDGSTNCYPQSLAAFELAKLANLEYYMPAEPLEYLWDLTAVGTALWNPTRTVLGASRSVPIRGAGVNLTNIKIVNATSIAWYIAHNTDWFDPVMEGFTVRGSFDFPLCVIGNNDFSDPVNMWRPTDVSFENSYEGSSNVALRLNYIAGGTATNLRCNSHALAVADVLVAVNGTALECRQAKFINFSGGGFGNANRSIDIKDGFNDGLTFISPTLENANYCLSHRSSNSGGNTLISPQMTNVLQYEVQSTGAIAGKDVLIINPNCDGNCEVDPSNYTQVRIKDDATVSTPSSPASGVSVANKTGRDVLVTYWGLTTLSSINLEGAGDAITTTSGSFILRAGKSVAINYTGTLTWRWRNAG